MWKTRKIKYFVLESELFLLNKADKAKTQDVDWTESS